LGDAFVARLAESRDVIEPLVRRAFHDVGRDVRTFADLTAEELAHRSGYGLEQARRALRRRTTVMLVDVDPGDPRDAAALAQLRAADCGVMYGGRWHSVSRGADKGRAVRTWLAVRGTPGLLVAIGDADNDASLLHVADRAFVVSTPGRRVPPALAAVPGAHIMQHHGASGWQEMLELLSPPENAR
jgi:predicted mannosyl-3-phosphoglycerate phosphatase (HAD superfamily)